MSKESGEWKIIFFSVVSVSPDYGENYGFGPNHKTQLHLVTIWAILKKLSQLSSFDTSKYQTVPMRRLWKWFSFAVNCLFESVKEKSKDSCTWSPCSNGTKTQKNVFWAILKTPSNFVLVQPVHEKTQGTNTHSIDTIEQQRSVSNGINWNTLFLLILFWHCWNGPGRCSLVMYTCATICQTAACKRFERLLNNRVSELSSD